jgi:uncharacterized protein DUF4926
MSRSNKDQINEFDMVALVSDLPEEKLPAGQAGAVVMVHNNGEAFEVEFPLDLHHSVVATVPREKLLKLHGLNYSKAG